MILKYVVTIDNSTVKVEIYNMMGKLVGSYNQGVQNAGTYTFTADMKETVNFDNLTNGIYICNLNVDGTMLSKRFVLKR